MVDRRLGAGVGLTHLLPLVGREDDLAELLHLLDGDATRLITISGLGGIGKTRLALETAARCIGRHTVVLELAAITDASYVLPAIAASLELPNAGDSPEDEIAAALGRRPTLLVLDNVEQLVGVHEVIRALLVSVPALAVIATSRVPLGIPGERIWRTAPLSVPDGDETTVGAPEEHASIQLFRSVATAVDSRFVLDDTTREHVAQICRRLGGHPLAIELAAARSARLGPAALRRELERGPTTRRSRTRVGAERPRDLDSTVGWSYEHLDPMAQQLFRRLAVFESWAAFELIESFISELRRCGSIDPSADVAEALETLVDHHLLDVSHAQADSAFRMLPPVRDVAQRLLRDEGMLDATQLAHERCLRRLVRAALEAHDEPGGHRWIPVLELARSDLASALDRAVDASRGDAAAELASALAWLWSYRRVFDVHRVQIDRAAHVVATSATDRRSRVLLHGWRLALAALAGASAARLHEIDRDRPGPIEPPDDVPPAELAMVLQSIWAYVVAHDLDAASAIGAHGLALVAHRDDRHVARMEAICGMVANMRGEIDDARALGLRALERARRHQDDKTVVRAALLLAPIESALGEPASIPLDEAYTVARRLGDPEALEWLRPMLAVEALRSGDRVRAAQHCADSFGAPRWGGVDQGTVCAAVLVALCAADRPLDAARIHGMLSDRWRILESHLLPSYRMLYRSVLDRARDVVGASAFERAVRDGMSFSWPSAVEQLLRLARELADADSDDGDVTAPLDAPARATVPMTLTPRELEVLRHLATGSTNKDIGAALGMRSKTVMHHTTAIYRKLGVHRRTEAAALAHRLGLIGGPGLASDVSA